MTAMLAAPLIALPALLWGWRGNLLAVAAGSLVLAAGFAVRLRARPRGPVRSTRTGYLAGYRALARIPGAVPLLMIGLLRTAAFMGYLAYLAARYDEQFGLSPSEFAFVWTLSGASFFVGNLLAGRYTAAARPWIAPERMLGLALLVATGSVAGFYLVPSLLPALALTALMGASHATVAACVVSLLVRRTEAHRGTALALNAAGQSLGVFVGAAAGATALSVAGDPGAAVAFGAITATGLLFAARVSR